MGDDGIDSWQEMLRDITWGWNIPKRRLIQMYNIMILFDTLIQAPGSKSHPLVSIITTIGEASDQRIFTLRVSTPHSIHGGTTVTLTIAKIGYAQLSQV
jgi:hypothetical protein